MTWGRKLPACLIQVLPSAPRCRTPVQAGGTNRSGHPSVTWSLLIGWMVYTRCGRPRILSPGCPQPSSLVGETVHVGRASPEDQGLSSQTSTPSPTPTPAQQMCHHGEEGCCPHRSFGAVTERSCTGQGWCPRTDSSPALLKGTFATEHALVIENSADLLGNVRGSW